MRKLFILIFAIFGITFAENKDLVGKPAPDFYGKDEAGNIRKLSEFKGKNVVVIFWAIGDVDTYRFLPKLNPLYKKYKDKVIFIAPLLSKSDAKEVKEAKKMIPLQIPVWLAGTDAIEGYSIEKIDVPYIVFIDKNQTIKNIIIRPKSVEEIEKNIKELIK